MSWCDIIIYAIMMRRNIFFLFLIFECVDNSANIFTNGFLLPITNIDSSTVDLIINDGYRVENHKIQTDDGYLIRIQRIVGKRSRTPVLITHGLCADSHIWVLNGKNYSLPYLLVENGFDVWLGNVRGNTYGKKHVKLSPSGMLFWKFSIDEIGIYDLPGIISYIFTLTHQKLVVIGYSMSANSGLIMNIKRHDMDVKVRLMIHLGPPVFSNTAPIASNRMIHHFDAIKKMLDFLGIYEWPPGYRMIKFLTKNGCGSNNIALQVCQEILLSAFNFDHVHVDQSTLQMILNHVTDTSSTMVVDHMIQWIKSGRFRPYDYGVIENLMRYKRIVPPNYNLSDIKIPTAIFYTEFDDYVSPEAINKLYHLIRNKAGLFKVESNKFSHMHFGFAKNAYDLVYKKIMEIIKKYD